MSNTVAQLVEIDQVDNSEGLQQDPQVYKIEQHHFATSNNTDLWVGHLESESGGPKKVVFKGVRGGIVKKFPGLKEQIIKRLRDYIFIVKDFDHPNVGTVFGLMDGHGPVPLVVLPFFCNGHILDYLGQNTDKTDEEKIRLAKGIPAALAYLHDNDIVHGGVHQGNVLVDDNGVAVVCDAKFDSMMWGKDNYHRIHSKWWMPPERLIAGDFTGAGDDTDVSDNVDDKCCLAPPSMAADIYGAAITIAQLWTLRRPFYKMRNVYELLVTFRKLKLGHLAQLDWPEEVPPPVWALIQDCLSVEPQMRPTAKNLLDDFDVSLKMR